jgi:mono/diheme cytochrome c family protein
MVHLARLAKVLACLTALSIVGIAVFVCSGVYNIAADKHHSRIVTAIVKQLRDRSVYVRSRAIEVPNLEDPSKIVAGADRYARLCAGCHLSPGLSKSDLSSGMYPHPPNLALGIDLDSQRLFWTVKHGIKMSAMPAWGTSLSDDEVWELVAFVRKMPAMSPENYWQLLMRRGAEAMQ